MTYPDDIVALGIPHLGVPQRELTRQQRNERHAAVRALSPEVHARYLAVIGRRAAEQQAAARPPAKHPASDRFLPLGPERDYWVGELRRLGLDGGRQKQQLWRAAKALADASYAAQVEAGAERTPGDIDVEIAFHESEAARFLAAAAASEQHAIEQRERASFHEAELVTLLHREGRL